MQKPFSLIISETEQKIVNVINESNIPAYCIKNILEKIYNQVNIIDQEETERYLKESEALKENAKNNKNASKK